MTTRPSPLPHGSNGRLTTISASASPPDETWEPPHDSHPFSGFTSGSIALPRLVNATAPRLNTSSAAILSHSSPPHIHTPQGLTMGLNNTHSKEGLPQQRTSSNQSAKMEEDNTQSTTNITAGEYLRTNERKDHEDDSTTAHSMDSSVPSPALSAMEHLHAEEPNPLGNVSVATTPSTVSTAPSTTDEASLLLDPAHLDRLSLRMEADTTGLQRHRRMPSWEAHSLHKSTLSPV